MGNKIKTNTDVMEWCMINEWTKVKINRLVDVRDRDGNR